MNFGIGDEERHEINQQMNEVLSNLAVLTQKVRNYHWNMKGDRFIMFHELLEDMYDDYADYQDDIAERVTTLGGKAIGTLDGFKKHSNLQEVQGNQSENDMIRTLANDHEKMSRHIRDSIQQLEDRDDVAGADLLTEILNEIETNDWKLRSHIDKDVQK